ncbi:MAG: hypothetical protein AAFP04_08090 [Myxococcota bacterium]
MSSRVSTGWFGVMIALLLVTTARPALAGHEGFYLRGQAGIGGARAWTEVGRLDVEYSGGAGALNLEVGGSLNKRWALFGKLYGLFVPELDYDIEGFEGDTDTGGFIRGIGIGTQHFFPNNFYLGGALTLSVIGTLEDGEQFYDSDPGPMAHVTFGKEWWVGRDTAIGLGAEFALGGFPDDDLDDDGFTWGGGFAVIYFSATYN